MQEYEHWKSLVDLQEYPALPDTVVSRGDDTLDVDDTESYGLVIKPKTDKWTSIGARISNLSEGATRARLYDFDGEDDYIATKDISNLSSGDPFAFEDVDLVDGQEYAIEIDNNGSEWTRGFNADFGDYPVTSDDLDITGRSNDASKNDSDPVAVNDVGNPDGVLN